MILSPRYLPRLASTIGLFTNYGLRDFAKNQGLLSVQGAELATDGDAPPDEGQDKAVAFRKRLVHLGPAYVKLGQVLSTRPDLLPAPLHPRARAPAGRRRPDGVRGRHDDDRRGNSP